jgi:hypothetical protein
VGWNCCGRRNPYPGAVTDVDETTVAPDLIATHYLTSIDDVTEHLRAANQLGLGVRVRSYLEPDEDGEGLVEHWEVELLTSSPVHEEEEEEAVAE